MDDTKLDPKLGRKPNTLRPDFLFDPLMGIAAEVLDDNEKTWIANSNRLRILTLDPDIADKDGVKRGVGLTDEHPDVARLIELVDLQRKLTDHSTKNLEKIMAQHPLHAWQQAHKGIGAKQLARLLAAIGDPYWNTLHERPRMVSELWAYCGMHVIEVQGESGTQAGYDQNMRGTQDGPVQITTDNHEGDDHLSNVQSDSGNQRNADHTSPVTQRSSVQSPDGTHTTRDHTAPGTHAPFVQIHSVLHRDSDHASSEHHRRPVDTIDPAEAIALPTDQKIDETQPTADHRAGDTQPTGVSNGQSLSDTHSFRTYGQIHRDTHEVRTYGVAPRRIRGHRSNWSEDARKRIWLISQSILKANGEPYRELYNYTRQKYANAVHLGPCIRCGPSGKPAQSGSSLSDGHKHARGLRAISKAVLKDLYIEAERLHQLSQ